MRCRVFCWSFWRWRQCFRVGLGIGRTFGSRVGQGAFVEADFVLVRHRQRASFSFLRSKFQGEREFSGPFSGLLLATTKRGQKESEGSFCLRQGKIGGEFGEGEGAVGDAVFYFGAQFSEGLVVAGGKEQGIVAESVLSLWIFGDLAFASSGEELDLGFVCGGMREHGEDAAESCGSFFVWHGLQ